MAEAIAFDLAVELITKLSSFTLSQIGLCWNVKDDLDDLKSTVSTIKAVLLDAEQRSVTSHLVKDWLEKLKDVLYDADDLLDDFSTEALRKDLLGGNKLTKEVRLFFSSSNQFAYGLKMGRQIKAIKARLTSIGSEAKIFNLVERDRPMETSFMTKRRHQTHSFKDNIIGRDDDKAALLKLMLEFESEENVSIIPIVGLGGLGKTALAQFVYNDEMVKNHFELMMFVCVSDVFDVKIIVENMIKSATGEAPNQKLEMDQLQTQLRGKIGGKKYLLVLDDIWNEEWEEWVSLKELLVGGAKGSRIIVTTRSLRVAKITSKCQPYVLKGLSDDDAWSLFKEIAFEQRYADSTNAAFVEIGKQILEGCGGVPLVIRTIASTLSFKETEKEWRSFKDNEFTRICQNEGKILDTLKLSYDHLPSHLKHCFAYCRLYPKDHEIRVRTLVQFWIAQGFVKQLNSNQSFEEIGLGYFIDLVERSFFQEVGERYSWEGLTYFEMIPRSICKLKHLRYLNLSGNFDIKSLPKSICKIHNLQALKLDLCWKLEELPKKIEKLVNLTHLGCEDCVSLTHMPRGIGKLTSLETLSMFVVDKDGSHDGADLSELSGLNNLRGRLEITNLGFVKNAKEKIWGPSNFKQIPSFAQLPCLQKLSIVDLTELEYMDDNSPKGSQGEPESFFPSLKSLCLENCPNMKSWWRKRSIDDDNEDDTTVIGTSMMVFPCLSSLEIVNCPLTSMPLYPSLDDDLRLVKSSSRPLKQTMKMNITSTTPSTSTSSLPLSKLKSFHVHKIDGLGTHMLDEYLKHFTGLKKLTIGDCKEVDLEGMQWEALKNLSHLEIINIPQLVSLPLGLQHLVQLKRLEIWNCSGLRSLFPVFQHLTFLEVLVVTNCKELELSAAGFQIFQDHTRLRSLSLENIPKCGHLPEWIQHLTNLQILSLVDWPNLTSLPDEMRCLTNLQQLNIHEVPQLEERCQKDIGADWYKIAHIPSDSWSRVGESLNTQCGCQVKSWKDLASEYLVVRMRLMLLRCPMFGPLLNLN
ncbi:hypothetical protein GOBAR_AA40466 [Gossypium barbadense]|uniref:Disease resistance protein RGA3 n=1 Tax=Gossypium barbadense TaxID=3634 RepID=A0A2P5VN57_GOSBA|nr:hypothetical protein GOBAR_AA40466 [Gossypium barbadense]